MIPRTLRTGAPSSLVVRQTELIRHRPLKKKAWTLFCIMIMTTTVYMASAIWSPAGKSVSHRGSRACR